MTARSNDWILITGAGGFVGGHCVRALHDAGHRVLALQRTAKPLAGLPAADTHSFGRILGDLNEEFHCPYPVRAIVHLAAQVVFPGVTTAQYVEGNLRATAAMFRLAEALDVATVVLQSSISVLGDCDGPLLTEASPSVSPAPYGATKYLGELMAREDAARRRIVAPRTPGIIGAGANPNWLVSLVERARRGEALEILNADAAFNSTLHVSDYSRFIVSLLEQPADPGFDVVNLASDDPISVAELARAVADRFSPRVDIVERGARGHPATIDVSKLKTQYGFQPMTVRQAVDAYIDDVKRGPG